VWGSLELPELLAQLAALYPATPTDRAFRPYVAADYMPPDSAHSLSNWWGVYEMFLALAGADFIEYSTPERLPPRVLDFVLRLESKKARWIAGSRVSTPEGRDDSVASRPYAPNSRTEPRTGPSFMLMTRPATVGLKSCEAF